MGKLLIIASVLVFTGPLLAQNPGPVFPVDRAPSGACGQNVADLVGPGGTIYTCQNGTWGQISGGGGSGTVTSVVIAGTTNQIAVTGTCTITTTGTCTLSLPSGLVIPGTINGLTITTTTGTLTISSAKVLTVSNSLTLAGTDGVTLTFPTTNATIARTDSAQTFTGVQTFSSPPVAVGTNVTAIPAANMNFTQTGASAVSRTQNSKNQDEVSTTDFGPPCDGSTNITTGFQNALNSGATKVHAPHGTGTCIYTTLVIPRGVEFYGDGRAGIFSSNITTNLVSTTAGIGLNITNNAGQGTTFLHDFNVSCASTGGSTGIEIGTTTLNAWVSNVNLLRVTVDSCGTNVLIQNAFEIHISGLHSINSLGIGLYIHPPGTVSTGGYTTSIVIDGQSVIASNAGGGIIQDRDNYDLVIEDTIIQDNASSTPTYDIQLAGTWANATIRNNYFEGIGALTGSAIEIADGGAVSIINNFAINYANFIHSSTAHTFPLNITSNDYNQGGGGGAFLTLPAGSGGLYLANNFSRGAVSASLNYTSFNNNIPGIIDTMQSPVATKIQNLDNSAGLGLSENLIRWSNAFDNLASWTPQLVTNSTPQASPDPFGGNKASAILETASTGSHGLAYFYGAAPVATNTVVTYSVWLAADGRTAGNIEIGLQDGATTIECYFDLTNTLNTNCDSPWSVTTTPAGNGFFKIAASGNLGAGTTAPYFALYTNQSYFGGSSFTSTGGTGFFIYGVQVNHSKLAGPYFQSSNGVQPSVGGVVSDTLQARTNLSLPGLHSTSGQVGLCIDTNGAVASTGCPGTVVTAVNCASAASPAVCTSASAGSIAFPTGVTSVALTVNTTAVTANSQIFLFSDDSLGARLSVTCNSTLATLVGGMAITGRTAGTSFTVTYNGTIATNPLCASFVIVN